ncbi:hypothetical protein UB37_03210 [Photobacterium iliopiscarium]|jgi:type II secretory pathway component PulF|uniref:DUF2970 domain-containing protein n=1 Tax=Photobacterium iliopiscarium TaxID=56192 RepID=A0ABX5GUV0_9GAMM|nr:DUF2970 domain-containing protein [Photobacterium iliopiscarium]KJG14088.1 hypothetical protein UB38_05990 [Photobacterium iliopiscarium]KJG25561.1 hypothetical protein UB37_03210 [Photobacterium iliopiscarium]MCD9466216.1 DUF2970 domain-containing protein [Photobacterium iliopiscarium]MCD9485811.1 DUF2970 domain-containing protein [Photobacterium iliopiscarium]MCF2242508.1 DUF2970 domain-containing protein [Photobacterium iliopiscarium]
MDKRYRAVWQIIKSVLAALFGVQSQQQHQQDFKHSSPWPFIVIGGVVIVILVSILIAIAQQAIAI